MDSSLCDDEGNFIYAKRAKSAKGKAKLKGPTNSHALYMAFAESANRRAQMKVAEMHERKIAEAEASAAGKKYVIVVFLEQELTNFKGKTRNPVTDLEKEGKNYPESMRSHCVLESG